MQVKKYKDKEKPHGKTLIEVRSFVFNITDAWTQPTQSLSLSLFLFGESNTPEWRMIPLSESLISPLPSIFAASLQIAALHWVVKRVAISCKWCGQL